MVVVGLAVVVVVVVVVLLVVVVGGLVGGGRDVIGARVLVAVLASLLAVAVVRTRQELQSIQSLMIVSQWPGRLWLYNMESAKIYIVLCLGSCSRN